MVVGLWWGSDYKGLGMEVEILMVGWERSMVGRTGNCYFACEGVGIQKEKREIHG